MRCPSLILVVLVAACTTANPQQTPARESVPPLPPLAANVGASADAENAYARLVEGIVSRTHLTAETGQGYAAEVRDLIVAPKKRSEEAAFPGAAILLVRQGTGTISGVAESRLAPGTTLAIPHGTRFTIDNPGEKHIVIRAYVLVPNR